MAQIPGETRVVIIGGGVVGCSVAYHLAKFGWKDVVLLERKQLSCGTTWHAAGLVGQLRATQNLTQLAQYTADLFGELEQETGQATGFKQNGSLSVAPDKERFEELKRGASMAGCFGLEVDVLTPQQAQDLYPILYIDDLVGAVYLPKDGQINPADVTQAFAKGARMHGATIIENVKVNGILTGKGRVTGVSTDHGEIKSEYVVNCAGMWARDVGDMAGVKIPLHASEHFYVLTEPMPDKFTAGLPVLRDPSACNYIKEDAGKLLVGAFEPVAKPWGMDGIPEDFCFDELPQDWDHFEPMLMNAMHRIPALEEAGIQTFFCGPESFTPDNRYYLGEAPELKNFFVACGFNSIGIQSSGGAGKVTAQWIIEGAPPLDLGDMDIRRIAPFQNNARYLHDRTVEALGLLYAMHWPFRQVETARNVRQSPLHDRLLAKGACFGELSGWERANWFAPEGVEAKYEYTYGRQNWFDHSAAEHTAAREQVVLFDQTSFAKFLLQGRDAERVINQVSANNMSVPVGRVVYTQWLNERGGIEADLTVTRLAEDQYMVVTTAATQRRDFTWLSQHITENDHAFLTDMTSAYATISIMGPNARSLLQEVTTADLSHKAFPFATSREIELGYAYVRATRITFVGELGWELYIPTEFATYCYDAIVEAGEQHGLVHAGYHALNSLRMEKGYRHWGDDIADEDSPLESGLEFVVKLDKPNGFIGREALLKQKEQGLKRRLVQFALDDSEPLLYHEEPIYRDGVLVGRTTSAMYGHTLGRSIALGYVANDEDVSDEFIDSGNYEIEIAGERYPASASLKPMYDPKNERIRI